MKKIALLALLAFSAPFLLTGCSQTKADLCEEIVDKLREIDAEAAKQLNYKLKEGELEAYSSEVMKECMNASDEEVKKAYDEIKNM